MGWGGQEIRILSESMGMRERGHRIIIIAPSSSFLSKKADQQGFEVIPVSFERKDHLLNYFKILKLIEDKKPNFINTHSSKDSWVVSLAARFSKYKPFLIRTRHLSTPVAQNVMGSLIYKWLPHKIITTGKTIKKQLIERNSVSADKITSIPTGIDLNLFSPNNTYKNIRNELSLPDQTPLVGMVSVLRSWKGHNYFIEAADLISQKLPDVKFLIVGDGPQKENLKRLVKEKELSDIIIFTGHRDDVPKIMASLDMLVHPSYANEGIPQSIIQGMAMSVPVVTSDLTALTEIVADRETGLIVPQKNSAQLAKKIMLLLKDKELAQKLGDNGRKLVLEKFSMEKMINSTEELYKRIERSLSSQV